MFKEAEKHFETCFTNTDNVVDVDQERDRTITRLTTFYTIVNPSEANTFWLLYHYYYMWVTRVL